MVEWYYMRSPSVSPSVHVGTPATGNDPEDRDAIHIYNILNRLLVERVLMRDAQGVLWSGPRIPFTGTVGPVQIAEPVMPGPDAPAVPWFSAQEMAAMRENRNARSGARSSHEPPQTESTPSSRASLGNRRMVLVPEHHEDTGARSSNEPPVGLDQMTSEEVSEEASVMAASETESEGSVNSADREAHDHHIAQAAFVLWTEGLTFDWTQMTNRQQDMYHAMVGRYLQNLNDD